MNKIKIGIIALALFIGSTNTSIANNIINNHEVWENGKVRYTFVDDSLYIDELGVEGNCYVYKLFGNHLYLTDEIGYSDKSISIYKVTKKHVWLVIDNKIYKFNRHEHEE